MKIKKNTEQAIIAAMEEMAQEGLPVTEFDPTEKGKHIEFDFKFSKGLTKKQQKKALEIASKYIDADWSFAF